MTQRIRRWSASTEIQKVGLVVAPGGAARLVPLVEREVLLHSRQLGRQAIAAGGSCETARSEAVEEVVADAKRLGVVGGFSAIASRRPSEAL